MSVDLPLTTRTRPRFRVVTAEAWGSPWVIRPMFSADRAGFEVLRFNRVALPDEATAVLQFHYGRIDGANVDPADIPDLDQHEVRIEVRLSTGAWRTVWWGQCIATRDQCFPGATYHAGTREYHCVDALHRLGQRFLDVHGVVTNVATYPARRHPGYNAVDGLGDHLLGASPFAYEAHTWPGHGVAWTDKQAVEHALATSRDSADPVFTVDASSGLLAGTGSWEVGDLETCRAFLTRVLDRRRGRGLAWLTWTGSDGTDTAPSTISPVIRVRPQVSDDVTIALAGGGSATISGATTLGTLVNVDVQGDARLGRGAQRSFQVADVTETQYDGVELLSECIRVLVTLSLEDASLAAAWSSTAQTAFLALTGLARANDDLRYDPVYRWLRLPIDWDLAAGDGAGGTRTRVDYRVVDSGAIEWPAVIDAKDTSPLLISILPRLPLYVGWDYTSTPAALSGQTGERVEAPVQAWLRTGADDGSTDRWQNAITAARLTVERHGPDLLIRSALDSASRQRLIGDTAQPSLASRYDLAQLALTVGLELPHRNRAVVGLASGKVKRIAVKGHHLWLAHPGAIYAIGTTYDDGGYAPTRGAAGASASAPGILRDDRIPLSRLAGEAAVWYTRARKTATWSLSDCGFTDGWAAADSAGDEGDDLTAWPQLGDVVGSLTYSGRVETIGTPITRIDYDADQGITTWATSWSDREWR